MSPPRLPLRPHHIPHPHLPHVRQLVILHGRRAGVVGDEEARDGGARYDEGGGAQDAEEHDYAGAE